MINNRVIIEMMSEILIARGWLANDIDRDTFTTVRAYAGRLYSENQLDEIYNLLFDSVITANPQNVALIERKLTSEFQNNNTKPEIMSELRLSMSICTDISVHIGVKLAEMRFDDEDSNDIYIRIGRRHLGPILASYAAWVDHHWSEQYGMLAGVMRDGGFLARAVAVAVPRLAPFISTVWLGRRQCLLAAIASADDHEAIRTLLVRARGTPATAAEAAIDFGLAEDPLPSGFQPTWPLNEVRLARFLDWLAEHPARRQKMEAQCREARRGIIRHLQQTGVPIGGTLGLLDVGYAANSQRALALMLDEAGMPIALRGFYLATTPGAVWATRQHSTVMGFLVRFGSPDWLTGPLVRSREVLESLLVAPMGPLEGYYADGTPRYGPSLLPINQLNEIARIQQGALTFLEQWATKTARRPFGPVVNGLCNHARLTILRLLTLPTFDEAAALGNWLYEDALSLHDRRPTLVGIPDIGETPEIALSLGRDRTLWPAARARLIRNAFTAS